MQLLNRTLLEGLVVAGHEVDFLQACGKDRFLLCERTSELLFVWNVLQPVFRVLYVWADL